MLSYHPLALGVETQCDVRPRPSDGSSPSADDRPACSPHVVVPLRTLRGCSVVSTVGEALHDRDGDCQDEGTLIARVRLCIFGGDMYQVASGVHFGTIYPV